MFLVLTRFAGWETRHLGENVGNIKERPDLLDSLPTSPAKSKSCSTRGTEPMARRLERTGPLRRYSMKRMSSHLLIRGCFPMLYQIHLPRRCNCGFERGSCVSSPLPGDKLCFDEVHKVKVGTIVCFYGTLGRGLGFMLAAPHASASTCSYAIGLVSNLSATMWSVAERTSGSVECRSSVKNTLYTSERCIIDSSCTSPM